MLGDEHPGPVRLLLPLHVPAAGERFGDHAITRTDNPARVLCHESAREHRLGPTIAFA